MNTIEKIGVWGETHHAKWLDILRVLLGVILFMKGIAFARDPQDLVLTLQGTQLEFLNWIALHYIPYAHLVGGLFIAIGFLTRLSVLFQIPVLLGAVFFTNMNLEFFSFYSELPLSIAVTLLLILFLIYGSGPLSVDEYFRKNEDE